MEFTCCINVLQETVIYCNNASNRTVSIPKGFSVFFWITLSHEVSRHFPTHINICELREPFIYLLYTNQQINPFNGGESDVLWKEEESKILDHQQQIASIQRFSKTFVKFTHCTMQTKSREVFHKLGFRSTSTTKEIDK